MTPFQALYGRPPLTIPHYHEGYYPVHEVYKNLASRDALLWQLKSNLHIANNWMKQQADSKLETLNFRSMIWCFWSYIPTDSRLCSKELIKSLQANFMGYIQLRKKLETLPINSSFPSTLVFTQTSICPFKKKKVGVKLLLLIVTYLWWLTMVTYL